jgi:hypothetical protein
MKQLKDHEVMDPQFLLVLLGNVAFLAGLKGGHNSCITLTTKHCGRGPNLVEVNTPPSNLTSFLVHKVLFRLGVTLIDAELDQNLLVVH